MMLINCTPHDIHIHHDGTITTLPRAERPARVTVTPRVVGDVAGIPVRVSEYGRVVDLPPPGRRCRVCGGIEDPAHQGLTLDDEGTWGGLTGCGDIHQFEAVVYIASMLVAQAAQRDDVLSPDDTVRDDEGRIVGCRALARPARPGPSRQPCPECGGRGSATGLGGLSGYEGPCHYAS